MANITPAAVAVAASGSPPSYRLPVELQRVILAQALVDAAPSVIAGWMTISKECAMILRPVLYGTLQLDMWKSYQAPLLARSMTNNTQLAEMVHTVKITILVDRKLDADGYLYLAETSEVADSMCSILGRCHPKSLSITSYGDDYIYFTPELPKCIDTSGIAKLRLDFSNLHADIDSICPPDVVLPWLHLINRARDTLQDVEFAGAMTYARTEGWTTPVCPQLKSFDGLWMFSGANLQGEVNKRVPERLFEASSGSLETLVQRGTLEDLVARASVDKKYALLRLKVLSLLQPVPPSADSLASLGAFHKLQVIKLGKCAINAQVLASLTCLLANASWLPTLREIHLQAISKTLRKKPAFKELQHTCANRSIKITLLEKLC